MLNSGDADAVVEHVLYDAQRHFKDRDIPLTKEDPLHNLRTWVYAQGAERVPGGIMGSVVVYIAVTEDDDVAAWIGENVERFALDQP